jgi:Tol biopolymer transport system component
MRCRALAFPLAVASIVVPLAGASSAARDGLIVFTRGDGRLLYAMHPDGSRLRLLTRLPANSANASISPDGRWVAFVMAQGREERHDIFIRRLGTSGARRVTDDSIIEGRPSWSPDGKRLVYSGEDFAPTPPGNGLYVVDVAGGGEPVLLSRGSGDYTHPDWSPDGRTIAYSWLRCPNCNVVSVRSMRANGRRERVLALVHKTSIAWQARWSPDGKRIVFFWSHEIWTMRGDGSRKRRLTRDNDLDSWPVWSPDGRKIAWTRQQDALSSAVYVMNADGSGRRRLRTNGVDGVVDWRVLR